MPQVTCTLHGFDALPSQATRRLMGNEGGLCRTSDPPMAQLWIALVMVTILGSTARISAVGASKTGLTSTK